jgi:hypothetical protein
MRVTKNLRIQRAAVSQDMRLMFSLDKRLRHHANTRRYSISSTDAGWEVREERDSKVVKSVNYQDWHRVERARRSINIELDQLQRNGWSVVTN